MTRSIRSLNLTQLLFLVFAAAVGMWLMTDAAFAQAAGSAGNFSCNGASAQGHLYDSGVSCPATISKDNIFSFLICNMEQLSSNLMGQMFCGMITDLKPAVMAVLVLSVVFFGISFTIGLIPLQAKDFMGYLIKFACVFIFATQSDYLIGFGYKILITGVRDGVAVAVSGLYPNPLAADHVSNGADMYGYLDKFLGKAISFATDYVGIKKDGTNNAALCNNALFAAMAIMAVAFPPIFYIGVMIIFKITLTFLRAVFGYVYALVGIAFLLTLSPFFLSFFLFKATRSFFEKWIGYLISMSLQMVIVFAFLSFVLTIDVTHVSEGLPKIVMYNDKDQPESTIFRFPWKYCTLCKFKVVSKDNPTGPEITKDSPDFIAKGMLVCKNPPEPIKPGEGFDPVPKKDPITGKPVLKDPAGPNDKSNYVYTMPDSSDKLDNLFNFATKGLLSLFVLAYLVDALLSYTAYFAHMLSSAGAMFAPQLGGGYTYGSRARFDIPGSTIIDKAGEDFTKGYQLGVNDKGGANTISATTQGVSNMFTHMVTGKPGEGGGVMGSFANWISNPNRDFTGE